MGKSPSCMFPVLPSQNDRHYIVHTSLSIQLMLIISHRKLTGNSTCKDFNSFPLQFCIKYHRPSSELASIEK